MDVKDIKPSNLEVEDSKPKSSAERVELTDTLYEQVLTAGMYMGIPPFTYPELGTVDSPFSP